MFGVELISKNLREGPAVVLVALWVHLQPLELSEDDSQLAKQKRQRFPPSEQTVLPKSHNELLDLLVESRRLV